MIFTVKNILELYFIEQKKIDLCISFLFGSFSSLVFMQFINKSKYPIWITDTNESYKKSDILEILYQEYLNTGDTDYELYEESITFNEKKVIIKTNNYEQCFYRTLK